MRNPLHTLYNISIVVSITFATLLASCTDSDTSSTYGTSPVSVTLRISTPRSSNGSTPSPSTSATRSDKSVTGSGTEWTDDNASEGEMMHNCFAVIVQGGQIQSIIQSGEYEDEKSYVGTLATKINPGTTTIYSFANIHPADIGLDANASFPCALPDGFDKMYFTVDGNQTSVSGFSSGIPMSNRQTVEITEKTQQVDLEVIRMVAKVQLQLTNTTPNDFTVKSVSLSDITSNSTGNIQLLPNGDTDLQPAISPKATKAEYTVSLGEGKELKANGQETLDIMFYVNESEASAPKYFVINVETDQTNVSHRVAMLKWNKIARNDFIVVPIKLNDYRMTLDVEQFSAIGVLPSVSSNRDMLTVRFHGYGDFHIRPHLIRISDGMELTPGTDLPNGWWLESWDTLEQDPVGDDGVSIYDHAPAPNHTSRIIEGTIGNRNGYALHQMLFGVSGLDYAIPFKVQIIKE